MKKNFFVALSLGVVMSGAFYSCDDDDDDDKPEYRESQDYTGKADSLQIDSANAKNWTLYMKAVSTMLQQDASTLYSDWNNSYNGGDSYAKIFKNANNSTFKTPIVAATQIITGCIDIASEVGGAKIGDPVDLWNEGKKTEALYAVESWYSWHSRVDYSNNIKSIRNAYFGTLDGTVSSKSISAAVAKNEAALDKVVTTAIETAINDILAIPQPFRNNINSKEAEQAANSCSALETILTDNLIPALKDIDDATLSTILENYVDNVVLPTYKELAEATKALNNEVNSFAKNPSDKGFESLAKAWEKARTPWESSEAFLFGPVADKGLDPNMDSWPLDQEGIYQILVNGNFSALEWSGEFVPTEEDEETGEDISTPEALKIAAAQSLRGFHTLEFLIFNDGKPRTIK